MIARRFPDVDAEERQLCVPATLTVNAPASVTVVAGYVP